MDIKFEHILAALVIFGVLYYAYSKGMIGVPTAQAPTMQQTPVVTQQPVVVEKESGVQAGLPIESLKVKVVNKFTMDPVSGVQIEFWKVGGDPSDPNQEPLDEITTGSDGTGSTTSMILQTGRNYDIYFNGSTTYYDEKIENWEINYNPETGKGFLLVAGNSFYEAVPFGAFVDVDTLPEYQSGVLNDTGTDSVAYDESAGTGSVWFKMDIGNANANSELWDVVMCFRDSDGDMEGDEITGFTASYVSGSTAISIPGSLLGYWTDAMGPGGKRCISIASKLGSAEKARWQFDLTIDESNFDTGEEFEITFDDLGDYSAKQYPSKSTKASAETLTFGVQA